MFGSFGAKGGALWILAQEIERRITAQYDMDCFKSFLKLAERNSGISAHGLISLGIEGDEAVYMGAPRPEHPNV
jgi:hypothetical protein